MDVFFFFILIHIFYYFCSPNIFYSHDKTYRYSNWTVILCFVVLAHYIHCILSSIYGVGFGWTLALIASILFITDTTKFVSNHFLNSAFHFSLFHFLLFSFRFLDEFIYIKSFHQKSEK